MTKGEQLLGVHLTRRDLLKSAGMMIIGLSAAKQLGCSESAIETKTPTDLTPIPPELMPKISGEYASSVLGLVFEGFSYQFSQLLIKYNNKYGKNISLDEVPNLSDDDLVDLYSKASTLTTKELKPEEWKIYSEIGGGILKDQSVDGEYTFILPTELRTGKERAVITITGYYKPESLRNTHSFELILQVITDAKLDYAFNEETGTNVSIKTNKNSKTFASKVIYTIGDTSSNNPMPTNPPTDRSLGEWFHSELSHASVFRPKSFNFQIQPETEVVVYPGNDVVEKKKRTPSLEELTSIIEELRQAKDILVTG